MAKILFSTLLAATFVLAGCASDQKNTGKGAGIGAGVGAVVGGIIGHQSGKQKEGALIGAALGGGLGAYMGHRMDKQVKELEKIAETKRTEQGLIAKMKSDILFDTGKSDLKAMAKANLTEMAKIMKKYPENVLTIKGYTDSTGTDAINQALSQNRADAVRAQLVASGLPAATISTVGMGELAPVADNATAAGRKQNRRVEVEVTVDESKVPKQ